MIWEQFWAGCEYREAKPHYDPRRYPAMLCALRPMEICGKNVCPRWDWKRSRMRTDYKPDSASVSTALGGEIDAA